MNVLKKRWREVILGVLLFATLSVWFLVYQHRQTNLLRVYFLDVGKGDSILIDSPTHAHILIDGGPDASVLSELGNILPFGDRNIDLVVESNPSAGSATGLVDVLKQYSVGAFIEPSIESTNYAQTILAQEIQNQHIKKVIAEAGTTVSIGGGAQIIFSFEKQNIGKIIYGNQTIALNGTSTEKMIEIETDGKTQTIK